MYTYFFGGEILNDIVQSLKTVFGVLQDCSSLGWESKLLLKYVRYFAVLLN